MPASADDPDESLCSTDTINPVPPPCPPYRVITVGALNSIDISFVDSNSHTYALAARKLSFTSTAAGAAADPAIVVVDTNTLTVVARLGEGITNTPGPNFTPFSGNCGSGLAGPNGVIIVPKPGGILEFWAGDAPIFSTADGSCSFTGHIDDTTVPPPSTNPGAGTTLTVTAVGSGKLVLGDTIFGTGVAPGTTITGTATAGSSSSCGPTATTACTGTGGTGTYAVSVSQLVASETMAAPGSVVRNSAVVVFSVNQKTWRIAAGYPKALLTGTPSKRGIRRADELCYNPNYNAVLIANDNNLDQFLTFFNANPPYNVIGTIRLDGTDPNGKYITSNGIEQCQYNARDGKFYLAVPDSGSGGHVLRISQSNSCSPGSPFCVEEDFNTTDIVTCKPAGLAVGPARQIALGCGARTCSPTPCTPPPGNSLIISDVDGSKISFVTGQAGADEIWYDYGTNHYYFARSTLPGTNPVVGALGVEDAGSASTSCTTGAPPCPAPDIDATGACTPLGPVPPDQAPATGCIVTASGSHSVAADSILGLVFVPVTNSAAAQLSTLCSGAYDAFHVPGRDNLGCIAVFQTSEPTPEGGALAAPASRSPKGGKKH
jgi:hypothetical protein